MDWDERLSTKGRPHEEKYRLASSLPGKNPSSSGRNTAAIIELACRDHILKQQVFYCCETGREDPQVNGRQVQA